MIINTRLLWEAFDEIWDEHRERALSRVSPYLPLSPLNHLLTALLSHHFSCCASIAPTAPIAPIYLMTTLLYRSRPSRPPLLP